MTNFIKQHRIAVSAIAGLIVVLGICFYQIIQLYNRTNILATDLQAFINGSQPTIQDSTGKAQPLWPQVLNKLNDLDTRVSKLEK